jgi:hypothetical protein
MYFTLLPSKHLANVVFVCPSIDWTMKTKENGHIDKSSRWEMNNDHPQMAKWNSLFRCTIVCSEKMRFNFGLVLDQFVYRTDGRRYNGALIVYANSRNLIKRHFGIAFHSCMTKNNGNIVMVIILTILFDIV